MACYSMITRILISTLFILSAHTVSHAAEAEHNPINIKEWEVPWKQTRPRDPYVDQQNLVWFVGQTGDYIGVLDAKSGIFKQFPLAPGTGPHSLIVDTQGFVWYTGNRAGHIGTLNPWTGHITKHPMPNAYAGDPHTLVFGKPNEIWFTVQKGNYIGKLKMDTGSILLTPLFTQDARPYGIVVDAAYKPWFTEFNTNKIGTIDLKAQSVREITLPRTNARPRRLAITSDGVIWYVDYAEGYLGKIVPTSLQLKEWRVPGGKEARPYGMAVDDQDRVWFVETGVYPNRLVGFDTNVQKIISMTNIESGGGSVRHMVYHQASQTIWFGTDANTIGRASLP